MSHSKNTQAEKSYGSGSDIENFSGKTDIKKVDGNNLMAKDMTLKKINNIDYIGKIFIIILHGEQVPCEFQTSNSPIIVKRLTFIS